MVRIRPFYRRSQQIAKCLSCDLCNQLLTDATKIIICFHTFCKKCIYSKLEEEELDCCPICDVHLGMDPFTKLRPDFNLQDTRNHLFPVGKEEEALKYLPADLMRVSGHDPCGGHSASSSSAKRGGNESKGNNSEGKNKKIRTEDAAEVGDNKCHPRL